MVAVPLKAFPLINSLSTFDQKFQATGDCRIDILTGFGGAGDVRVPVVHPGVVGGEGGRKFNHCVFLVCGQQVTELTVQIGSRVDIGFVAN